MWNSFTNMIDSVFNFMLQGNAPQEVIPWFLAGVIIMVCYLLLRMSRGDVK